MAGKVSNLLDLFFIIYLLFTRKSNPDEMTARSHSHQHRKSKR
jgi:hypothetical protein